MSTGFSLWTAGIASARVDDVMDTAYFARRCGAFINAEYARATHSPHAAKANPRNIILMLYADGVNATRHSDYSMFVISCMIVNLPSQQRRLRPNILPLLVIPGPRPPADLTDFLQPLIDELASLWRDGVSVRSLDNAGDQQQQLVRAMLYCIVADSRAHPKLTMMMQSPARFPCHLCEVQVRTTTSRQSHDSIVQRSWPFHGTDQLWCNRVLGRNAPPTFRSRASTSAACRS